MDVIKSTRSPLDYEFYLNPLFPPLDGRWEVALVEVSSSAPLFRFPEEERKLYFKTGLSPNAIIRAVIIPEIAFTSSENLQAAV
ncbi:hypothetical protein RvY_01848 [Ramazzottius varieornatus]|uniref:Uncharacterized protein n=1 Tax=Ramazzottius varieornatus TaxID=947166 RepID=A0A1D1UNR1_RAMVA|nr:hypothetical protein RvY_01848 [Ramazzottius varieornatus]